ncbi:MAG: pre-peptidase C-terminal domain-containing protein [Cyanobacteriota bacterium]|nr:pre-peptidase C-terminal domain-containing protein [Cyanobacteriota bacterium]
MSSALPDGLDAWGNPLLPSFEKALMGSCPGLDSPTPFSPPASIQAIPLADSFDPFSGLGAEHQIPLDKPAPERIASSSGLGVTADALIAPGPTSQAVAPLASLDNAGNTRSTARNIGTLSGNQTFSDWVGSTDTNDYYRFDLSQASSFSLSLSGLSAEADVQLLGASGSVLASSAYGGTTSEVISRSLNAGTYFVRVYP